MQGHAGFAYQQQYLGIVADAYVAFRGSLRLLLCTFLVISMQLGFAMLEVAGDTVLRAQISCPAVWSPLPSLGYWLECQFFQGGGNGTLFEAR